VEITLLTDERQGECEEFIRRHLSGSLYHHPGWCEVIRKTYEHECLYLHARTDEGTVGVLPLAFVRSRIFGVSLTSLPYLDAAGVVADNAETSHGLFEEAIRLGRERSVDYLELRQTEPLVGQLQTETHKVSLTLPLADDPEGQWRALSSERRNRIRKTEKAELTGVIGGGELLVDFYRIWSENMRDLGSPAHSRDFFGNILKVFEPFARLIMIKRHDKFIGGAVCLWFKDWFYVPWVSSLRSHFRFYPNNLLYWEAMKLAIAEGCRVFDFGRSSVGSGTHTFKKRWGAAEKPLYWQFKTFRGGPARGPGPESLKYRLAVGLWKRLPLGLSRSWGPKIRKYITA
jgi:FemAB-related protein (PEP-CTERM system-associated)